MLVVYQGRWKLLSVPCHPGQQLVLEAGCLTVNPGIYILVPQSVKGPEQGRRLPAANVF